MSTLKELIAQKEALEAEIARVRDHERQQAITQIQALLAEYNLTITEILGTGKKGKTPGKTTKARAAIKYRDPVSGATWTGRGRVPKWLEGKDKAQYAISPQQ